MSDKLGQYSPGIRHFSIVFTHLETEIAVNITAVYT